jgi:hypothetical protein
MPPATDLKGAVATPLAGMEVHPETHTVDGGSWSEPERAWCGGLSIWGDYLLMKPRRNALDYAISSPNLTDLPGGNVERLEWEVNSGFRGGLGWQVPGEPWQINASYTYLHAQDSRFLNAPTGGTLYATLTRAGGIDDVTSAAAFTNLNFNVIDLEATHLEALGPHFDLTLFAGGRYAWIKQNLDAVYNGGSAPAVNATVNSPIDFHGGGFTAGGEGFWKIYRGFGLFARARGSILSGSFRNTLVETNNNGATSVVNVGEKYHQIVPVTELALGVAMQTEHFTISVGYELANWFDMVNSLDFPSSSNVGKIGRRTSDLSLEGLAVHAGLVF